MLKKLKDCFRADSPYRVFFLSILMTGIGYGLYKGMLDNYMADVVHISESGRGVVEFFRQIPGLLLVFITAALYAFSAERIYKIGAIFMLGGMVMISVVPASMGLVTIAICVYSLGEHIQLGMKNTLSLEYAREGMGGKALGFQNAISNVGTLVGYVVVIAAFTMLGDLRPYRTFFGIASVLIGIAMLMCFRIKGESAQTGQRRFYFRKKYTKYYMLQVFYGARKQVFFTFGPYVLILHYHADATVISLLFAISAIACYFLAPLVGSLIDKVGYKIVMISDTLILVIVCFFYGFADHIFPVPVAFVVCCVNYVLDSVISLASMASNVYVQDLSDNQEETRATISTGISVNHMITILIALFGGVVWEKLGVETLFMLSAFLGLCNSAYAATVKTGAQLREAAGKQ